MRIIDRLIELQEKLESIQLSFRGNIHKQSLSEEEKKGRQYLQGWAGGRKELRHCAQLHDNLEGWDISKCLPVSEAVSKGIIQQMLDPNAPFTILVKEDLQYYRNRRLLSQSRIAMRKLRYTKCATPNVKRSKEVEP